MNFRRDHPYGFLDLPGRPAYSPLEVRGDEDHARKRRCHQKSGPVVEENEQNHRACDSNHVGHKVCDHGGDAVLENGDVVRNPRD